jgi:hypothetical protein
VPGVVGLGVVVVVVVVGVVVVVVVVVVVGPEVVVLLVVRLVVVDGQPEKGVVVLLPKAWMFGMFGVVVLAVVVLAWAEPSLEPALGTGHCNHRTIGASSKPGSAYCGGNL